MLEDVAILSLIDKLKKIKDGKFQVDNFQNELEKTQYRLIQSILDLESYILTHPSFEIEEEEVTMYGLVFEDGGLNRVVECTDFDLAKI